MRLKCEKKTKTLTSICSSKQPATLTKVAKASRNSNFPISK